MFAFAFWTPTEVFPRRENEIGSFGEKFIGLILCVTRVPRNLMGKIVYLLKYSEKSVVSISQIAIYTIYILRMSPPT